MTLHVRTRTLGALLVASMALAMPASAASASSSSAPASTNVECLGVAGRSSHAITLDVDGQPRQVWVHVPATSGPSSGVPVVLVFHGYRDTAQAAEDMTGLSAKADTAGFMVVYPQAMGAHAKWDFKGDTDIAFVGSILATLSADACVDTTRIYAAGFSMGGGMATVVGCRLADRIAAVASVSGVHGPNWGDPCGPTRAMPMVAFHGLIDPQVPYTGGPIDDGLEPDLPPVIGVEDWASAWAQRNGCDANPVPQAPIGKVQPIGWEGCLAPVLLYRIGDGGHTWPGSPWPEPMTDRDISATDLIWEFVSQFSLPAP